MLERVVINLMGNAVKFTPEGGRVEVALTCDDHTAEIAVSDTGIRIPADEQERLFSRFFRSSLAQQQAIPGSGLGLLDRTRDRRESGGAMAVDQGARRGTDVPGSGSAAHQPPDAAMATIHRDAYGVPHVLGRHGARPRSTVRAAPYAADRQHQLGLLRHRVLQGHVAAHRHADLARRAFARLGDPDGRGCSCRRTSTG